MNKDKIIFLCIVMIGIGHVIIVATNRYDLGLIRSELKHIEEQIQQLLPEE